jgi:hypothetical protein
MKGQEVTESPEGKWTRPEDYLGAMARKRSFRRGRRQRDRTEPESPRLFLSTVPFFALIALLGVLAVAIMVAAFPGSQPIAKAPRPVPHEQGVAQRGWLQEARKDFHG